MKYVTVYASSSNSVVEKYGKRCEELGEMLVENGYGLVFGGSNVGLMNSIAIAMKRHKGKIVSVIPDFFKDQGLGFQDSDEMIVTKTMQKRMEIMMQRGDAFIALPGGFGTLEEITEVLTQRYLKKHKNPILLMNYDGFYDPLMEFFEHIISEKLASALIKKLYKTATNNQQAIDYLETYEPFDWDGKWLSTNSYDWKKALK